MRDTLIAALALALAAGASAQNPPTPRQAPPRPTAAQVTGGGTAQYLAENPQVLNLNPTQVARIRKVAARVDSANAPLTAQWQQLTGGRALRELPPADRRRMAPQLQPLMQQMRANNEAGVDSVDAILTPEQQERLANLREEYRERLQMRRRAAPRRP
jgi:hypothetical protein